MLRTTSFTAILLVTMFFSSTVEAATLFITPGVGEFGIGKEVTLNVKIDSNGVGINAGQATIRFPKDTLTVKSVSKTNSAFSFWIEEPTFSNEEGFISFVGGTPYGISGASIQILQITFTSKGSGTAGISIVDGAVTSSDGSGTNVLSKTDDASITIVATKTAPAAPISPPTQIVRIIAEAVGLPIKPSLLVPLYSNPAVWYNKSDIFTVSWELPNDISGIASAINKQPNFSPNKSEGLFDNKMFEALTDGVWYLHIRFRNEIGWGPTTHYRIGVDTKSPLPFDVVLTEGEVSDNPSPIFKWSTSDTLSDLKEYKVRIDTDGSIIIPAKDFTGSYKTNVLKPGKHYLVAEAMDNAGNSIESGVASFEVLPLASPFFTFVTEKLFSNEASGLSFKGTALPSTEILFTLKKGDSVISESIAKVGEDGNWEHSYNEPIRNGKYVASIQSRDTRGALSLIVQSVEIQVTGRYTSVIIILFTVLLGLLIAGYIYYRKRREKTTLRVELAARDTSNVFNMMKADIQKLQDAQKTSTTADDEFIAEKLKKNVEKMSSYIKDEIDRVKN